MKKIRFTGKTRSEIAELVALEEVDPSVVSWALYVERGPKEMTRIRDGLISEDRLIHSGPREPYRGYLFLRSGPLRSVAEDTLRLEVDKLGTHNIVARLACRGSPEKEIAIVFRA